ncbi:chromatin remodelling complex Rsc7/Swp82 subunit-domain-containing protein [Mrakia frigida]|uniref:Npl6p n=1 Tax=Mrakia frigida TaxID=29902 RepID=UPI003FCBFEBC
MDLQPVKIQRTTRNTAGRGGSRADSSSSLHEEEDDDRDEDHDDGQSDEDENEENDDDDDEQLIDDDSDSSVGFRPNRSASNPVVRGRPRGRPRGSRARGGSTRARGGPRGRPRGSRGTRARGRPRGRGGASSAARLRELERRPLTGDDLDGSDNEGEEGGIRTSQRTVNGKEYTFTSDELILPDDEKGDTKIDSHGVLQGGREYKANSFASPYRPDPEKLYILSIDAARTCGYRDSLYFFRRNKELVKLTLSGVEKEHLIDIGRLSTTLKTRSVTMIAARNCYKLQGAKMLKNARWVTDDYYEDAARADCLLKGLEPNAYVGDLPDPALPLSDRALTAGAPGFGNNDPSGSGTRIEKHMPFYTVGGPTTHFAGSGVSDPFVEAGQGNKKLMLLRNGLTPENWMLEFARGVQEKNRELAAERRERLGRIREGFWYEKEVRGGEDESGASGASGGPSRKGKERASTLAEGGVASFINSPAYAPSPLGGGGSNLNSARATPARDVSVVGTVEGEEGMSGVVEEGGEAEAEGGAGLVSPTKKRKRRAGPPVGVYDPHTHITHVRANTQPTRATLTRISDLPSLSPFNPSDPNALADDASSSSDRKPFAVLEAIGGQRVGTSSWGLASVVLGMEVTVEKDEAPSEFGVPGLNEEEEEGGEPVQV